MPFFKKLLSLFFPFLLILLCVYLCFQNYTPNTFLIGWDSLHPEFNFQEAFSRLLWGVWREEQGLGAIAAHAHMGDFFRVFLLSFLSPFVDFSLLRYSYIFLMVLIGPLGVFYLLKYIFRNLRSSFVIEVSAFLGSLYYLLNIGTLQHFFVVFEMFAAQFGFLPWLFLFALKFFENGEKKDLVVFSLVTIVSASQAYASTLFYAYFGALALFFGLYFVSKPNRDFFKRYLVIIFSVLALNSYWILPNIYSGINQSEVISRAKINQLFSPEAFLRNKSYGDIVSVLTHKNFLFDWKSFDFQSGQFVNLLEVWRIHLSNINVLYLQYGLAVVVVLGALVSLFKIRGVNIAFLGVTVYSLFFLTNSNYSLGIYDYLYKNIDIFREALRFPFTKFSIIFIFVSTYFLSYFSVWFLSLIKNELISKTLALITLALISGSLIYVSMPMFKGNFLSIVIKHQIPNDYMNLFNWFESHSQGRVATFPIQSHWGWFYRSWGYEGSDFLTYGIKNPILNRDFDRWSKYNESFYNQISTAFYSNNKDSFAKVMEKYEVKYLLLDESVINAGGDSGILMTDKLRQNSQDLGYKEVFKSGFLTIYDTNISNNNTIKALNNYSIINADLDYSKADKIYETKGDYVFGEDGDSYPFVNFDQRAEDVDIAPSDTSIVFENSRLVSKASLPFESKTTASLTTQGVKEAFNCDIDKLGSVTKKLSTNEVFYEAKSGGVSCDFFNFSDLKHNHAYVLRVKGENLAGRNLKIYLQNWQTKRMDLEELMPQGQFDEYFVIYPQNFETSGYTINLETRSFGRIGSQNKVNLVEFYPTDVNFLNGISNESKKSNFVGGNLEVNDVKKWGTGLYEVETQGQGLLNLSQGFEKGWIAFQAKNLKVFFLDHKLVNSWSNGWVVDDGVNSDLPIYILFWPQLLEWLGIVLTFATFLVVLLKSKKTSD